MASLRQKKERPKSDKLKVFICTAKKDLPKATKLRSKLLETGWVVPWLFSEDLTLDLEWEYGIKKAMLDAHMIIICMSSASINSSGYYQKEITDALKSAEILPEGVSRIIPLLLDKCEIPMKLAHLTYLDYFEKTANKHQKLLLSLEKRAKDEDIPTFAHQPGIKPVEQRVASITSTSAGYASGTDSASVLRKLSELVLDEEFSHFDPQSPSLARAVFALAELLKIDEKNLIIRGIKPGSVRIFIELPEWAYERLDYLVKAKDKRLYRLFKIKSFGPAEIFDINEQVVNESDMEGRMSSEPKFVGRQAEKDAFRRLLLNPYGEKRIALILGGGGIGKTLLVKELLKEAREQSVLAPKEPIDLFSTDCRHIDGLQRKIKEIIEVLLIKKALKQAQENGVLIPDAIKCLLSDDCHYDESMVLESRKFLGTLSEDLKGEANPFSDWEEGKTDTSDNFYEYLKNFCVKHPFVLAFDTFENLDTVASKWLFKSERGGLQVPGLVCIIAGREENRELAELDNYRQNYLVQGIPISGFTLQEAVDFHRRIEEEFKSLLQEDLLNALGMDPSEPIHVGIERIWEITTGHPLKLEMAFRWAGNLLKEGSLANLTSDQYEEELMQFVRGWGKESQLYVGTLQVSQPLFETLLCMAYIVRRFDKQILQHLVGTKFIHLAETPVSQEEVVDYLRRYFFVKTRDVGIGGLEIIQLHDEMARLVREHVWPYQDPSGEQRNNIYRAIIQFYANLIEQDLPELTETLQVEQLYYMLQLDREGGGLQRWFELAELGNENINKLLPGEIKDHIRYYDIETRVRIFSRIAEMEKNAYHINQALGYWEDVRKLGETTHRDDWVVDALRGKFNCVWMSDPEKALQDYLMPALKVCENVPEKLAAIYYEIGFACNQMQKMKQAVEWYEKGLTQFKKHPDDSSLEATLYNDAGYAYLQRGMWGDASKYLNEALDLRLDQLHKDDEALKAAGENAEPILRVARAQSAMFVGLSYNTLGEYHRYVDDIDEALVKYNRAYQMFEEVGDYFWQAKCLCARGETHRRLGRKTWREQGVDAAYREEFALARQDVERSLYLCQKYQLDDERDTANRRLGRLAHDEAMIAAGKGETFLACEKLEEAYGFFKDGLEFAQKTSDVLEELENLTELAFLADDALLVFGKEMPEHYHNAVKSLEEALVRHEKDQQRIYWYPVFTALLQMIQAAISFEGEIFDLALELNVEAFKGLGTFPGYGHTRYKQHFDHLKSQVMRLPKDEQMKWRERFVEVWTATPMTGWLGKTLADDLLPDLVKWFNMLGISRN